jgi:hypothetical protein
MKTEITVKLLKFLREFEKDEEKISAALLVMEIAYLQGSEKDGLLTQDILTMVNKRARGWQSNDVVQFVATLLENKLLKKRRKGFSPPDQEMVYNYFYSSDRELLDEKDIRNEANQFYNYHSARGWQMGNVSMQDWRSAINLWRCQDYSKVRRRARERRLRGRMRRNEDPFD